MARQVFVQEDAPESAEELRRYYRDPEKLARWHTKPRLPIVRSGVAVASRASASFEMLGLPPAVEWNEKDKKYVQRKFDKVVAEEAAWCADKTEWCSSAVIRQEFAAALIAAWTTHDLEPDDRKILANMRGHETGQGGNRDWDGSEHWTPQSEPIPNTAPELQPTWEERRPQGGISTMASSEI